MQRRATDCICVCFGYAVDVFGVGKAPLCVSCLSSSAPHETDQVAKFLLTSKQAQGSDHLCGI